MESYVETHLRRTPGGMTASQLASLARDEGFDAIAETPNPRITAAAVFGKLARAGRVYRGRRGKYHLRKEFRRVSESRP